MTTAKFKLVFFDRAAVKKAVGAVKAALLSKGGAFIRRRARSSMRSGGKKGASSPPGVPPRTHVGKIKDLLFFGYDTSAETVVIGPAQFRAKTGKDVPNLLEFGGTESGDGKVMYATQEAGRDEHGKFVSRGKKRIELSGTLHYKGNPFMGPALRKEIAAGTIPELWKDSIRGN